MYTKNLRLLCLMLLPLQLLRYGRAQSVLAMDQSINSPAPSPPMGWNSWDSYGTTVNEQQVKANADWMAAHLKTFGWQYITVDMEWFVTDPKPEGNAKDSHYQIDASGRS